MRTFRIIAVAVSLLVGAGAVVEAQGDARQPAASGVETRLFPLQFISNQDAAALIAPFVQTDPRYGVFEAGPAVRGITVRAPKELLVRVDSLLKAHDRAPLSAVLRFQLIAALDSSVKDPTIPSNVDATLRDLFKFGGYRVLAQASATVGTSNFEITMSAGTERYTLTGTLGSARGRGGRGTTSPAAAGSSALDMSVNLAGWVSNMMQNGSPGPPTWQTLFSTGLTVPIGETVVLGSAAAQTGGRRALILTVRPEILAQGR